MLVQSLGCKDPLEEGMTTPCSILAWKISWTEESSELQSIGSLRVRHDGSNLALMQTSYLRSIMPVLQLRSGVGIISVLKNLSLFSRFPLSAESLIPLLLPLSPQIKEPSYADVPHIGFCVERTRCLNLRAGNQ